MRYLIAFFLSVFYLSFSFGQIIVGTDTLYGNEWINYDQPYFKMLVAEDGMYKVTGQELQDAGVPITTINGNAYQLFHNGKEIPIYTSTDQPFQPTDFLLFYGEMNRAELDRYLFQNPEEEMMNPRYSLITDSSAYFLTWGGGGIGKRYMEEINDLANLPPKTEWCWYSQELVFDDRLKKEANAHGISKSNYTRAEGYATNWANAQSHAMSLPFPFIGNVNPLIKLRYSGNLGSHQLEIKLNEEIVLVDEFYDYEVREPQIEFSSQLLNAPLTIELRGLTSNNDRHRLAFIYFEYPHLFEFENSSYTSFALDASSEGHYLEINNFDDDDDVLLFNLSDGYFITAVSDAGILKFKLPANDELEDFVLVNTETGALPAPYLSPTNFTDYTQTNAEFIIISSEKLFDDGNGVNWIEEYANYRSSNQGGGYNTLVVKVQDLYDQFAWGLNRHPLSIRNFAWWVKKNWSTPKYILLIGKGLEYYRVRTASALASNTQYYLPTWGVPGSDNLLVAGNNGYTPIIPIGRVACWNTDDLRIYFEKVKQFEAARNKPQTIDNRLWMKNLLHLGGGNAANPGEQQLIRNYLKNFEDILATSRFGSHTMSYYKTSSDPIQQPQTDLIFDYINNGVSLVTFFGHSGLGVFDLTIDFPENYHNQGKYYWMLSLGCYAGNIHTTTRGIGERFVFMEEAGPIAFTATAGQGFISALGTYVSKLYDLLGNSMYGQGLGNILQATNGNFSEGNFGIDLIRQQFNLLGDPSLSLNPAPGPDYVIDPASVQISPERIVANQGEGEFKVAVANLGQNLPDSIILSGFQQLPDGSQEQILDTLLRAPSYKDEYVFKLPSQRKETIGLNRLHLTIDADDRVEELPQPTGELNNKLVMSDGQTGFPFLVRDNSAVPVYPPEFAIVDNTNLTLKAYTTDPLAPERKYIFELDTTDTFDDPIISRKEIVQQGGVLKWTPDVTLDTSKVYFWRVSPDSLSPENSYLWSYSSFIVEPGNKGWNQSASAQFSKNQMVNLQVDQQGKWAFPESLKEYILTNAARTIKRPGLLLNNYTSWWYYYTPAAGYYITWIDSVYLEPMWNYYPGEYGLLHPWGNDATVFMFNSDANGRKQAMDFLTNVIPEGDYVLFTTMQTTPTANYQPHEWVNDSLQYGYSLLNILEENGAQLVRQLPIIGSVPYAVVYRKGHGLIAEKMAGSAEEIMELKFVLEGNWDRGYLTSQEIGPAKEWHNMVVRWEDTNSFPTDSVRLNLVGLQPNGNRVALLDSRLAYEEEIDLSFIDPTLYPRLSFQLFFKDSLIRSAPQLKYIKIYFTGVPEYTYNLSEHFNLKSDSLQQGAPLVIEYDIENLTSELSEDSLAIEYSFRDESNNELKILQTIPPLGQDESKTISLEMETRSQIGNQLVSVELNPDFKPEQLHTNNYLDLTYHIYGDKLNPVVEVTFDGRRILDGEIVSSRPVIQVRLKDENQYLLLTDTSAIKLAILRPDSANFLPVYLNSPELDVQFANEAQDNQILLTYRPELLQDGEYTLLIQAKDMSGNASGSYDFKQRFRVTNQKAISNFVNYPNPFSTSTRFVYTLTGDRPPEDYRLQILSVSGRIVREVSKEELGPLRIGTNMTVFAWDGRDQFGDQVATGVYLYRFLIKDEASFDSLETSADQYTVGGVGKMVLIR